MSQEYFEAFHKTLSTLPTDSLALIRADGATLARSPALTPEQVREAQTAGNYRKVLDRLLRGVMTFTSPLDHATRIVSYRKLAGYPIFVGYWIGTNSVLASWRFHLVVYGLVAALAGLALSKRLPDEPRLRRYVEGAIEGARRGASLTQRLLAFSRRQELAFEAVDVATLVRGMTDLFERSIGPTISIETRFPMRLPPGRTDASQLEAALLNLVVNARDAMLKGGRIVISGREETLSVDRPFDIAAGRYVTLSVADAGEGMSADTIARATEPFFTTKSVGKGTGLGLAMVHGLAAQCGGALRIHSEVGCGTTIEVWLPLSAEAVFAPERSLPTAPSASRQYRVLLVDDDALVRAGTAAMLEDLGHGVVEVGSGREALDLLRDETTVDVIVTDQVMPGMLGTALVAEARTMRPDLPIVLASGFAEFSDADAERFPRLAKPFTQDTLARAIDDAVLGIKARNVVPMPRRTGGSSAA